MDIFIWFILPAILMGVSSWVFKLYPPTGFICILFSCVWLLATTIILPLNHEKVLNKIQEYKALEAQYEADGVMTLEEFKALRVAAVPLERYREYNKHPLFDCFVPDAIMELELK